MRTGRVPDQGGVHLGSLGNPLHTQQERTGHTQT